MVHLHTSYFLSPQPNHVVLMHKLNYAASIAHMAKEEKE